MNQNLAMKSYWSIFSDKSTSEKMMSDEIDHEMMKPNKMMMKDKMKPEKMNDQKKKDEMVHEMDQMHKGIQGLQGVT